MRVVLVDDEPLARLKLRQLLAAEADVVIAGECESGRAALDLLASDTPDLVLLDVQMPGISGIDVAAALPRGAAPRVVFVTAYDEYAVHAFELHAVDYLLKPVRAERLADALARVRAAVDGGDDDPGARLAAALEALRAGEAALARTLGRRGDHIEVLQVEGRDRAIFLRVEEIDWIEGAANYVRLHAGKARYLHRATLHELEARLDPARFVRVHRSAIVNLARVREKAAWGSGDHLLRLADGTTLRLSRTYRAAFDARTGRGPRQS
jgi:two-component system LytT family response regulator